MGDNPFENDVVEMLSEGTTDRDVLVEMLQEAQKIAKTKVYCPGCRADLGRFIGGSEVTECHECGASVSVYGTLGRVNGVRVHESED